MDNYNFLIDFNKAQVKPRNTYAKERDYESAKDWWDSRYDDEWEIDGKDIDLHPCPVVDVGMCERHTCKDCKMPEVMHKRNEEWTITERKVGKKA